MTVRTDIAELLNAGYGDRTIARQLGVTQAAVAAARTTLGLPKAIGGIKPAATPEDLFWRRVRPLDGGHLEWTGHRTNKGTPVVKHGGHTNSKAYTAYRIAFRIIHGTDPIGHAHVTCDHPGCVAPAHVADSAVTPRRGYHRSGGGPMPKAARDQIVDLLRAGGSNSSIARQLHTDTKRVARVRAEERMPAALRPVATFAEKWAASTEDTADGHVRWTGRLRDGVTPSLVYRGREYTARRAAFEELHGRAAEGLVLPGCGWEPCVRPEHLEDRPMREALAAQLAGIFGEVAA